MNRHDAKNAKAGKLKVKRILFLFLLIASLAQAEPRRIVSIAPGFTEILYGIGLDQEIVGTTNYCDYPEQAKRTTKIGDVLNPNIEKIIALHPDMVFCGAWKWQVPEKLRSVGIQVVEIKDAETIPDIYKRIMFIGEKVGKRDAAAALVSRMKSKIQMIREKTSGLPHRRTAYVELDVGNWTVGGASYMNEILEIAGMTNIFADRKDPYMMVTMESIASRNPDLILSLNRKKQEYTSSAAWQTLDAVKNERILDKDALDWNAVVRQGPRMVDGIEELANLVSGL